jgi:chemotaxis protein MotA
MDDLDLDSPNAPAASDGDATAGASIDWGIVGGLLLGFGALLAGMLLEHTSPVSFLVISAMVIVFGGTIGATLTSVGLETAKTAPQQFKRAIMYAPVDRVAAIRTLVKFAEKARREGLLVLEDDLQQVDDEFLRKGVQLVVDGTDPELVKEILQTEVDSLAEENERNAGMWSILGGFSPTLGIIGTVMGLVNVLAHLSDAASLGPAIAVAFVATFYGVMMANLFYLPIGFKLGACSQDEISGRELMIEGILAIQSGDNPRIVEEKLVAFLDSDNKLTFLEARAAERDDLDLAA